MDDTETWAHPGIGRYGRSTGRKTEITYGRDEFEVGAPSNVGTDPEEAPWGLAGTVCIRTPAVAGP
ncbi:MAG: hypothetical protein P8188_15440 [Gemmatimonadota bacterium]|jgi:hypothetical protein